MKPFFGLLLISVMYGPPASMRSQVTPNPFVIAISTDHPVVKAGSDIWIKVKMTNTSTHDVDCTLADSNGIDLRYSYDVRDDSGNPAEKKVSKHPELEGAGSFRLCKLKPGQSTVPADNRITSVFNMQRPGQYQIQVSRGVGETEQDGFVKSNTITITVTP